MFFLPGLVISYNFVAAVLAVILGEFPVYSLCKNLLAQRQETLRGGGEFLTITK